MCENDRLKACFEAGIKLATIFHQFIGTPVSIKSKELLCKSIEEAIKNQPFTEDVEVRIESEELKGGYKSLSPEMLSAVVKVKVGKSVCIARLRYDRGKDYPLMFIDNVYDE